MSSEKQTEKQTENQTEEQDNEIEIPIKEEQEQTKEEQGSQSSQNNKVKVKDISKLTLEERAKIITDARNGIQNPYYEVIILKNGNSRIVKRKNKPQNQSLASKLINQNSNNQTITTPDKIYMSDNQLLMEHIIELNNQVNKLMNKHKKLKKKYKSMKHDIYETDVDENEISKEIITKDETPKEITKEEINPQQSQTNQVTTSGKPSIRKGWRSYVSYL